VRRIDCGRERWELQEISGMAPRHVTVNQKQQHALDKAVAINAAILGGGGQPR
jgi:hypothetical protein